jgi:ribosomal protein S2
MKELLEAGVHFGHDIEDAKSIIGLILAGIKFGFVYE